VEAVVNSLISETGRGDTALQSRSILYFARNIRAETLILNGERDDRTDPDQARHLVQEINRYGSHARAIIYPDYGHQIPVKVRNKEIDPFIDRVLGK
jgi:dipeptidyl aminopeptidase/acylaminoacyl peptidase